MRTLCACALLSACTSSATTALFVASGNGSDFYDLPFPNDLRRHGDGTLDLSKFPTNSLLGGNYRDAVESELDGFSLNAAIFSRFSAQVDKSSLPDTATSMQPGASVYLVNVDANSPDYGALTPIIASWRDDGTNTIGGNRLVVRPYPGFPLDEATTYALVITDRVRDADGAAVAASDDFMSIRGGGGSSTAKAAYAPLLAWLPASERSHVVSAAVFTTQHATFIGPALRAGVFGTAAPVGAGIAVSTRTPNPAFALYEGTYVAPNFQTGDVPYLTGGGEIQVDANGVAIAQRMENMRFALSIPPGPTPATGWPIVIYQHGTGGDWESFVDDRTAQYLAQQGLAVISTDQVLHGPRNPGGDPAVSFYNFGNPYAARDNALQGAADAWSQMRLALGLSFTDGGGRAISFDPARVMFFGHSQGGLTSPPFLAFEPAVKGAVLSGTGGVLYLSALFKTAPVNFPALIETLTRDSPMDEDNPSLALAQLWMERADGVNYAGFMVREPQTATGPRAIFQSEGFTDTYAPDPCIEAFATALGGDLLLPDIQDVPGLTALRGRKTVSPPVVDNANGTTAILAQYQMAPGSDGHFVVFDIATARTQSSSFLGTLAATGQATVVSP
jgi:predicted esterase